MNRLDIDMLSFETVGTREIVSKLREENDKNILINTFSEMDDEVPDPEQVDFLDKIEYVTGYGKNYWAGVNEEITLVRLKETGDYYWFLMNYPHNIFESYKEEKKVVEDVVFKMDMDDKAAYFLKKFSTKPKDNIIPGDIEAFQRNIWWEIGIQNKYLRKMFELEVKKLLISIEQQYIRDSMKYFKETPGVISLLEKRGSLQLTLENGKMFEVTLIQEEKIKLK
ncbi:hypothetical protein [Bacillus toyonensis]|uniref:hypothetical protein n=1 Tax=Bacillus toyonensis TaxID=155322 RepID=UPI002E1AA19F|nr:hypothetical protein [Bacillus toyonensis]